MTRFLLLLVLGVAGYVSAFPPYDLGPVSLLSLTLLGRAFMKPKMGRWGWVWTYLAGVGLFAWGCAWIGQLHVAFPFFMAAFEGLALLLFCLLFRSMVLGPTGRLPVIAALPLAWVAVEYLRSVFPLDGFPWLLMGYTWWRCTPLIQLADVTGVFGLSFLTAMGAGVLLSWWVFWDNRRKGALKPVKSTVLSGLLLGLVVLYGLVRPGTLKIEEGPVVAVIQANIPQALKDDGNRADQVYQRFFDLTQEVFEGEDGAPSLVVWPETIFPFPLEERVPAAGEVAASPSLKLEQKLISQALVRDRLGPHGTWFLTGAISFRRALGGAFEERNSAFLYSPKGERKGQYSKSLLVPGGEYLPWIDLIPWHEKIKSLILDTAGFIPDLAKGYGPVLMQYAMGDASYKFGVTICFENIYGDYCRRFAQMGADFMINLSNEGWFKESSEFDQMLAMSLFRAVETRRSLLRSTNTGISCLVGPLGDKPGPESRIMEGGKDRAVEGVLKKRIPLCSANSIYTKTGDLFALIVFWTQIIVSACLLLKRRWGKKMPSSVDQRMKS